MKVSGQLHAPAAFWLRNINGTNSIQGCVGSRDGLGLSGKKNVFSLSEFEHCTTQPLVVCK